MAIIRGYWDCSQCENKHIDGLKDTCPSCGKRKPDDVRYYMGSPDDIVSEEELNEAGIGVEECDGEHKEWVCPYCEQLNNWADKTCAACGCEKNQSEKEYGDVNQAKYTPDEFRNIDSEYIYKDYEEPKAFCNPSKSSFFDKISNISAETTIIAIAAILMAIFLFFPVKTSAVVTGISWERTIYIEEIKTFEESGWSLPAGARLQYSQTEFYGTRQVLDHYETKTRQASRQVSDGYDTHTGYRDNGNGTFSPYEYTTPRYRTEFYTETYQDPVYRDEPVYKEKYYYEIDRWVTVDEYSSTGDSHDAYWNEDYTLFPEQRDVTRSEKYYVTYLNRKKETSFTDTETYNEWLQINIGDSFEIIKSPIGIVYKNEKEAVVMTTSFNFIRKIFSKLLPDSLRYSQVHR